MLWASKLFSSSILVYKVRVSAMASIIMLWLYLYLLTTFFKSIQQIHYWCCQKQNFRNIRLMTIDHCQVKFSFDNSVDLFASLMHKGHKHPCEISRYLQYYVTILIQPTIYQIIMIDILSRCLYHERTLGNQSYQRRPRVLATIHKTPDETWPYFNMCEDIRLL